MLSFIYFLKCIPKNLFLFVDRELWYIRNSAGKKSSVFFEIIIHFLLWPVDILSYLDFQSWSRFVPRLSPGCDILWSLLVAMLYASAKNVCSALAGQWVLQVLIKLAQLIELLRSSVSYWLPVCLFCWILYFYLHRIPWSDTEHILLLWVPSVHQGFQLL